MGVVEKLTERCAQYRDGFVAWYDGLEKLYQYGLLYVVIVAVLFVAAFFMLSRITR